MLHVVLFQPEIPPNTGNIIRLCANTGTQLSLIAPLGFDLEDRKLRRAGLDYREFAKIEVFECLAEFSCKFHPSELFAFSTRGRKLHSDAKYSNGNANCTNIILIERSTEYILVDNLHAWGVSM